MEIKSSTGQLDIVPSGQREQTEVRKKLMTHIRQKELPSAFLPSCPQLHSLTLGADTGTHLMRKGSSPPPKENYLLVPGWAIFLLN